MLEEQPAPGIPCGAWLQQAWIHAEGTLAAALLPNVKRLFAGSDTTRVERLGAQYAGNGSCPRGR